SRPLRGVPHEFRCRPLRDHHATPLNRVSTSMPQSVSSHSGTYTRFRLRAHQRFSGADAAYSDFLSPRRLTSISNSVGKAGTKASGLPQLGFPRGRFLSGGATVLDMVPDHTLAYPVRHENR